MVQKFKTVEQQITKTQPVESNCRSITFEIQTGASPCFIDNKPLIINRPYTINGYPGELNTTIYNVRWGTGGDQILYVTREFEVK